MNEIETIADFRDVDRNDVDAVAMPMESDYRSCTDPICTLLFLIVFAFAVISFYLCYDCIDIAHHNPYDQCGNFCGIKNQMIPDVNCSGKDNSFKNYLQFETTLAKYYVPVPSECVEMCNITYMICGKMCWPRKQIENYDEEICQSDQYLREIQVVFENYWWGALTILVLIILYCTTISILIQIRPFEFIWGCLILCFFTYLSLVISFWTMYGLQIELYFLVNGAILSFIGMVPLCVMLYFSKYINLAAMLIAETSKIFTAMPFLIGFGLLICFLEGILVIAAVGLMTAVETCQTLGAWPEYPGFFVWIPKPKAISTIVLIFVLELWMHYTLHGCLYVVFGNAIALWYFIRDKSELSNPFYTAAYNLFRFHLGSVFFGAPFVPVFEAIRIFLEELYKISITQPIVNYFLMCCGDMLSNVSAIAYVQIGINGQSFCKSGTRARKLAMKNVVKLSVIKFTVACVMFSAGALICLIAAMAMYTLSENWYMTLLAYLLGVIITLFFASLYRVTNDSLLMNYYEDLAGKYNPPYITETMQDFVDEAKPIVGERDSESSLFFV